MTCLENFCNDFRSRVIQCRARAHYRLNRWKASRVRRKWLRRENEYRKELELIFQTSYAGCYDDEGSPVSGGKPEPFYPIWDCEGLEDTEKVTHWKHCNKNLCQEVNHHTKNARKVSIRICETFVHYEEGVSVLSPQRLSERLSENALAREAVGESDVELAQYLKDERIALFLQNDEFITELRSNQEFMSALQREHDGDSEFDDDYDYDDSSQNYRGRRLSSRRGEGGGSVIPPLDDATFKERLATMGKASRKKFAQIAKVFSRGKRGAGARSLLPSVGGSASANGKDLLMSTDPLIDDYDEDRIQSAADPILSSSPRNNP